MLSTGLGRLRLVPGRGRGMADWRRTMLTMGLGVVLAFAMFALVRRSEDQRVRSEFRELADERISTVRLNTGIALDVVSMLAAHFAVSPPGATSQADFRALTAPLIARNRFIQALEWIPRVTAAQRQVREHVARAQGRPDFGFTERDAAGHMVPEPSRATYFPVYYVEPVAGNRAAIGYDLGSNPARRAALLAAAASGRMTATERVVLVQETGHQYGVLLYAPVYRRSARTTLRGFALGVFRIGDFIEAVQRVDRAAPPLVQVHLYDVSAPLAQQQLYPRNPPVPLAALDGTLQSSATFSFGGRKWLLVATPTAAFAQRINHAASFMTLMAALLAIGLFGLSQRASLERADHSLRLATEMARAKQRLDEAHRIAHLGFVEADAQGARWRVSDGAARMLGVASPLQSTTAEQVCAQVHPDDRDMVLQMLRGDALAPGGAEFRIGERHFQLLAGDAAGPRVADLPRLLTIQDVTQRHQTDAERARIMTRMIETGRLEALGTLAGGIAHEINTPLQFIGDNLRFVGDWLPSLLQLAGQAHEAGNTGDWTPVASSAAALRYDFAATELPEAISQALDGVQRVDTIVRAIKEFSFPSEREAHDFDLNHAVRVTRVVTRNQWKYVAEFELELADDLPPVFGIESEINQVIVNLIINAADAIEERGETRLGRIVVCTRHGGDVVELHVRDDGVGIAAENLPKVFDLFFTTKPPGRGTGQGLAISKAIVLRHGGSIEAISPARQGTTFIVRLPLKGDTLRGRR